MSERFEYYIINDDTFRVVADNDWYAQTFTPALVHKITSVKLRLAVIGLPGDLTVSIKATDGEGKPTLGDLCFGTTDADTLTNDFAGEWREIALGAGFDLEVDTKYAIVVRLLGGDASNKVLWRGDFSSATYPGGEYLESANSGGTWTAVSAYDFMFEEWGEGEAVAKARSYGFIFG